MKKFIFIYLFLSQISAHLFAQKFAEFTVKTADSYPFGIFVDRNGKENDFDLLKVDFKFLLNGRQPSFFNDLLPYALLNNLTRYTRVNNFNFDSINRINEKMLLKGKHLNLIKAINKCIEPFVIIETKTGHLYKFSALPYYHSETAIYRERGYLNGEIKHEFYNSYLFSKETAFGFYNFDTIEHNYFFYKKYLPKIGNDSIVRFHLIQCANSDFKRIGLKTKIYTSNWVNYPALNDKKYYEKIDTTIFGIYNNLRTCEIADSMNRGCFLRNVFFNSNFFTSDYIRKFEKIDSFYTDSSCSFIKTKNYIFTQTYFLKNVNENKGTYKEIKSTGVKCLNDTISDNLFNGVYTNDSINMVINRFKNLGYIIKYNTNGIFNVKANLSFNYDIRGNQDKFKEIIINYTKP